MKWEKVFLNGSLGLLIVVGICVLLALVTYVPVALVYTLLTYVSEAVLIVLILQLFPTKRMKVHMIALGLYWGYDMITKMSFYVNNDLFVILNHKLAYGFIIFVGVVLVVGGFCNGKRKLKRGK